MSSAALSGRVDRLEAAMAELALAQAEARRQIALLVEESRGFQGEMRVFKDEMRVFKDEMRVFKDEMRGFKDEMVAFKDEMVAFKDEMRVFKEETRAASDRADQRMDELARHNGRITNKLGRLVEDIVGPSVPEAFTTVFGATLDQISGIRIKRTHPVHRAIREFDAVAVGGDTFLVVDVKSQQTPESIERFVTGLPETREYFPDWMQGRRLFGAVASFHVDPSLVATAERRGLLVFGLARDLIDLLNTPGFQPREY